MLVLQADAKIRRDGPAERVELTPPADEFARYQQGGARRALEAALPKHRTRAATAEETRALRTAAQRLAGRGVISAESQALFDEFLGAGLLHQTE